MQASLLLVEEEYGFRYWKADMDKCRADELLCRWAGMRNLSCLVPVTWVIPWAVQISSDEFYDLAQRLPHVFCHLHEHDDSHLDGRPPPGPDLSEDLHAPFEIDGKSYPLWGAGAVDHEGPLPY